MSEEPPPILGRREREGSSTQDEVSRSRDELEIRLQALEAAYAEKLAEQNRKTAELEHAYKAALLDRELATALAGRSLIVGAAAQLIKLWREDFDVIEEHGTSRVVARDGRPLSAVVAERLSSPEYAHFCPPSARGGTATRSSMPTTNAGSEAPPPRNLGEATIRRWLEDANRFRAAPAPVGLGRRR